jgi:hypothetical protein
MRRVDVIRALSIALQLVVLAAAGVDGQSQDPDSSRIHTVDIERFWLAFDSAGAEVRAEAFERLYVQPASAGLQAFMPRIGPVDALARAVVADRSLYLSVRESTLHISDLEPAIRRAFRSFHELYPDAVFPDVYFVIGQFNSAGGMAPAGLLIGAEHFGLADDVRPDAADARAAMLRPRSDLVPVLIHELVHAQQREPAGEYSLLVLATAEGIADFVAERVTGRHGNERVHEWAAPRESELWREFEAEMHGENTDRWLYNGAGTPSRPGDLGYYIGYRIAQAYYEAAVDKREAIRYMLALEEYAQLLELSGYPGTAGNGRTRTGPTDANSGADARDSGP